MLITLERPDKGLIRIGDEYLWHASSQGGLVEAGERHARRVSRRVGMVFQQFNLFPHMKVLRNVIEAPMRVRGLPRKEAVALGERLLDQVGLSDKVDEYPDRLSGGQQQRVAIARALAMEPEILLFDEITSALDPELVGEVLAVLRELALRTDMTMLFVTHEMRFAREVADRVVMFDHGEVLEQGAAAEILVRPSHPRTRAFLRALLDHDVPVAESVDVSGPDEANDRTTSP
jgi:polar amino acid transport system ATP-binding protein